MDTITIILIFGTTHGFIIGSILYLKKHGNRVANKILAVIIICLSFIIAFDVIGDSIVFANSIRTDVEFWFVRLLHLFSYLLMPMLYFYTKGLTVKHFTFNKLDILHTLPFFILLGTTIFFFLFYNSDIDSIQDSVICTITDTLLFPIGMTYIITSLLLLHKHEQNIKTTFSSIEKINLRWLKFLLYVFLFAIVSTIPLFIEPYEQLQKFLVIIMVIVIYIIGYKGLMQPEIFTGEFVTQKSLSGNGGIKYKKSALTTENADAYFEKLLQIIKDKKPYLESDLTLPNLAKMLSISVHHLSQVINEKCQQSYFDFINHHRIEESKRILIDPANQNLNIAAIALKVGFNSLSSFNAAFKKNSHMTPSQFKAKNPIQ